METQYRRIGDGIDLLGEGPVWSVAEQALYWVDIRAPAIRRWIAAGGAVTSWPMPEPVGSIALCADGRVLAALQSGLALFSPLTGTLTAPAALPDHAAGLRLNDGRCDRQGRFWVGSMALEGRAPVGRLYRLDADGITTMQEGIAIPNSLCWSPDGRTMYFSDSPQRVIWAYDYDTDHGTPGRRRVFAEIEAPMVADGAAIDAEGYLWSANYNGSRVTRFAPDGRVDRVVPLPALQITCGAFGGPALDTLFVTSATQNLSAEALAQSPLAGALFAVDVGVHGLPESQFAGSRALTGG